MTWKLLPMSFKHKVVLVTGSSSGIGASTVIRFAKEGALVVIVGRNEAKLRNVEEKCEKYGPKPLVINADVSIDADVKRIIKETVEKYGRIDVLVNNTGIGEGSNIMNDNFMENYDRIINVNLRGVVFLTHLAIPYVIKSKGNIVNISSVAATRVGIPSLTAYCVSKAGLNHFTRSAAINLASYGVRVNTISPGAVRTDIIDRQGTSSITFEQLEQKSALKRVSEPEEIADLILFLASDKAKGITGSEFISDNGATVLS